MTDQDQCDPLSFKGQMAARYRERLSMGFTLGPAYFEAEQAQIRPRSSPDTPGSEPPHDTQEEAQLSGRSGRPTVTRSRSSLGEHLADAGKPSMKELITKFERRSHTASQLRQSKHVEEDGGRMARDAWESNYPRIKMELDPSAPTSSSSSDTVGSKSLTTMSKTAYAKTSRAALSLNSDIIKQQIHRNSDSPHPQSGNKITEERKKFGARDELNNANSNVFRDLEPAQTPKRQMSDVSTAPSASRPKEGTASFAAAGQQNLSAKSHEQEDHKMSSEEQDPAKTQPLRVSLRGIAARRKMKAENKYVVHKKEWGKLLPTSKQAPGGAALILTEPGVQNTRPKSAIERDTTPKCSRRDVVQDLSLQNLLCDASTASANTHKKSERRSSLRQIASRSEIKVNDEKKKASAVERYLQFLKSSHPPQHSSSALKMSERYELRKASRPPTPYRTAHARRGNSGSSKNNLLNLKDSNQSIPSRGSTPTAAEALQQKRKLEKEARGTLLSHFRPRSKPLPSSGREIAADHSMGELIVNAAHSSSNSVDSNNYGDTRKASPYSHVGHRRPDQLFSQFASTAKTPEKLGHTSGKVSPLASGNAIQLTHVDRVRPDAGGKMAHDEDQSYHAFLRTRSPSSGKASHAGNPKLNILQRTSQREPTPASPRDGESLAGLGNSVHIHAGSDRKGNLTSIEPSDFWSHILTADELADNDLIPSHLRDRKTHGPSGHITRLFSSSEESNSAMVEPPGKITPKLSPFTKVSHLPTRDSAVEKSAVIDTIGTQYIAKQKRLNLNRDFFPRGEGRSPRVQTHIPLYGRRSGEGNRLFHLNEKNRGISQGQYVPYGSRAELIGESGYNRYTNSNLSRTSGGQPNTWGDSKNRLADKLLKGSRINMGGVNSSPGGLNAQIPHVTPGTGGLNPQYSQVPHVNHQPPHVSPASSNPAPPYVFQTENTGYSQYRDARDHAAVSPAMAAPAPTDGQSKKTQDVVLQADAVPPFLTGASTMQHKESPAKSKQDIRPAVPGAAKDSAKFSGGLMESGPILQQDAIVGTGDIQLKGMKFAHFGQTGGLNEDAVGLDKDSSLFASPQKKKRKVEKNKKMKKKKKKVKDDGDYDNVDVAGSQNVPKSSKEKRGQKEKTKENKEKTDANEKHEKDDKSKNHEKHEKKHEKHKEHHEKGGKLDKPDKNENVEIRDKFEKAAILDKMENMEKNENAEKHGKLIRRKSVENMPKQKKKERREMSPALDTRSVLSGDNSNCSVKHDKSSSVKKDLSPLKLSALGTVSRLTYEPTDRFPCRSRIPHLKAKTFAPRKKLDRLIQYRRWREAMLDCLHPSRLPLTESFRKSLDSAVMEEWALHCWQPTHDLCVDSHGIWWSASYQEVTDANMTESLLGEVRGGHVDVGDRDCPEAVTEQAGSSLSSWKDFLIGGKSNGSEAEKDIGHTGNTNLETSELNTRYNMNSYGRSNILIVDYFLRDSCNKVDSLDSKTLTPLEFSAWIISSTSETMLECFKNVVCVYTAYSFIAVVCKRFRTLLNRTTNSQTEYVKYISMFFYPPYRQGFEPHFTESYMEITTHFSYGFSCPGENGAKTRRAFSFDYERCCLNVNNNSKSSSPSSVLVKEDTMPDGSLPASRVSCDRSHGPGHINPSYTHNLSCRTDDFYLHGKATSLLKPFFFFYGRTSRYKRRRRMKLVRPDFGKRQLLVRVIELLKTYTLACDDHRVNYFSVNSRSDAGRNLADCLIDYNSVTRPQKAPSKSASVPGCTFSVFKHQNGHRLRDFVYAVPRVGSTVRNSKDDLNILSSSLRDDDSKTFRRLPMNSARQTPDAVNILGCSGDSVLQRKGLLDYILRNHFRGRNNNSKDTASTCSEDKESLSDGNVQFESAEGEWSSHSAEDVHGKHEQQNLDRILPSPSLEPRRESQRPQPWKYLSGGLVDCPELDHRNKIREGVQNPGTGVGKEPNEQKAHICKVSGRRSFTRNSAADASKYRVQGVIHGNSCRIKPPQKKNSSYFVDVKQIRPTATDQTLAFPETSLHHPQVPGSAGRNKLYSAAHNFQPKQPLQTFIAENDNTKEAVKNDKGDVCAASRERARKGFFPCKTETRLQQKLESSGLNSREKSANAHVRQGDVLDTKRSFNVKCDDTETCKTSPTWNEDTTWSRSLRRDGKKSLGRSSCRKVFIDPKVTAEVQRKVQMMVKSYRDFLEKEEEKRRAEGKCWEFDEIESRNEVRKSAQCNSPSSQMTPTKWEDVLYSPPDEEKLQLDNEWTNQFKDSSNVLEDENKGLFQQKTSGLLSGLNQEPAGLAEKELGVGTKTLVPGSLPYDSFAFTAKQKNDAATQSVDISNTKRRRSKDLVNARQKATGALSQKAKLQNLKSNVKSGIPVLQASVDFSKKLLSDTQRVNFPHSQGAVIGGDTYDLILTYGMQNDGQWLPVQQDCQQPATSVVILCPDTGQELREIPIKSDEFKGFQSSVMLLTGGNRIPHGALADVCTKPEAVKRKAACGTRNNTTSISRIPVSMSRMKTTVARVSKIPVPVRPGPLKPTKKCQETAEERKNLIPSHGRPSAAVETRYLGSAASRNVINTAATKIGIKPTNLQSCQSRRSGWSRTAGGGPPKWSTILEGEDEKEKNVARPLRSGTLHLEDLLVKHLRQSACPTFGGRKQGDQKSSTKYINENCMQNDTRANRASTGVCGGTAGTGIERKKRKELPQDPSQCGGGGGEDAKPAPEKVWTTRRKTTHADDSNPVYLSSQPAAVVSRKRLHPGFQADHLAANVPESTGCGLPKDVGRNHTPQRKTRLPKETLVSGFGRHPQGWRNGSPCHGRKKGTASRLGTSSGATLFQGPSTFNSNPSPLAESKFSSVVLPKVTEDAGKKKKLRMPKEMFAGRCTRAVSVFDSSNALSCADSSTSSWSTALLSEERYSALSFSDTEKFEKAAYYDCGRGRPNSFIDHRTCGHYDISSSNICKSRSNSQVSSLSTMRNISDLPYTFPSFDEFGDSKSLASDNFYRMSNCNLVFMEKDGTEKMAKKDVFKRSDYNTSNRMYRLSLSEPNLTALTSRSQSNNAHPSRSVLDFTDRITMLTGHSGLDPCHSVISVRDRSETPYESFATNPSPVHTQAFDQLGEIPPEALDKLGQVRPSAASEINNDRQKSVNRQVRDQQWTSQSGTAFGELTSEHQTVFQQKDLFDPTAHTRPAELGSIQESRMKCILKAFEKEPPENLMRSRRKILLKDGQDKRTRDSWRLTSDVQRSFWQISSKSSHASKDDEHTSSPRSLPAFSKVVQFWEQVGPVVSIHEKFRDESRIRKLEASFQRTKPVVCENRSSGESSTVYLSVEDDTRNDSKGLMNLPWFSEGTYDGREEAMKSKSRIGSSGRPSTVDAEKYLEIMAFLEKLAQQNSTCRGWINGLDLRRSSDNLAQEHVSSDSPSSFSSLHATKGTSDGFQVHREATKSQPRDQQRPEEKHCPETCALQGVGTKEEERHEKSMEAQSKRNKQEGLERRKYSTNILKYKPLLTVGNSPNPSLHEGVNLQEGKLVAAENAGKLPPPKVTPGPSGCTFVLKRSEMPAEIPAEVGKEGSIHYATTHVASSSPLTYFPISGGLDYTSGSSPEMHMLPVMKDPDKGRGLQPVVGAACCEREIPGPVRTVPGALCSLMQTAAVAKTTNEPFKMKKETFKRHIVYTSYLDHKKITSEHSRRRDSRIVDISGSSSSESFSEKASEKNIFKASSSASSKTKYDFREVNLVISSSSEAGLKKESEISEQTTKDQIHSSELDKLSASPKHAACAWRRDEGTAGQNLDKNERKIPFTCGRKNGRATPSTRFTTLQTKKTDTSERTKVIGKLHHPHAEEDADYHERRSELGETKTIVDAETDVDYAERRSRPGKTTTIMCGEIDAGYPEKRSGLGETRTAMKAEAVPATRHARAKEAVLHRAKTFIWRSDEEDSLELQKKHFKCHYNGRLMSPRQRGTFVLRTTPDMNKFSESSSASPLYKQRSDLTESTDKSSQFEMYDRMLTSAAAGGRVRRLNVSPCVLKSTMLAEDTNETRPRIHSPAVHTFYSSVQRRDNSKKFAGPPSRRSADARHPELEELRNVQDVFYSPFSHSAYVNKSPARTIILSGNKTRTLGAPLRNMGVHSQFALGRRLQRVKMRRAVPKATRDLRPVWNSSGSQPTPRLTKMPLRKTLQESPGVLERRNRKVTTPGYSPEMSHFVQPTNSPPDNLMYREATPDLGLHSRKLSQQDRRGIVMVSMRSPAYAKRIKVLARSPINTPESESSPCKNSPSKTYFIVRRHKDNPSKALLVLPKSEEKQRPSSLARSQENYDPSKQVKGSPVTHVFHQSQSAEALTRKKSSVNAKPAANELNVSHDHGQDGVRRLPLTSTPQSKCLKQPGRTPFTLKSSQIEKIELEPDTSPVVLYTSLGEQISECSEIPQSAYDLSEKMTPGKNSSQVNSSTPHQVKKSETFETLENYLGQYSRPTELYSSYMEHLRAFGTKCYEVEAQALPWLAVWSRGLLGCGKLRAYSAPSCFRAVYSSAELGAYRTKKQQHDRARHVEFSRSSLRHKFQRRENIRLQNPESHTCDAQAHTGVPGVAKPHDCKRAVSNYKTSGDQTALGVDKEGVNPHRRPCSKCVLLDSRPLKHNSAPSLSVCTENTEKNVACVFNVLSKSSADSGYSLVARQNSCNGISFLDSNHVISDKDSSQRKNGPEEDATRGRTGIPHSGSSSNVEVFLGYLSPLRQLMRYLVRGFSGNSSQKHEGAASINSHVRLVIDKIFRDDEESAEKGRKSSVVDSTTSTTTGPEKATACSPAPAAALMSCDITQPPESRPDKNMRSPKLTAKRHLSDKNISEMGCSIETTTEKRVDSRNTCSSTSKTKHDDVLSHKKRIVGSEVPKDKNMADGPTGEADQTSNMRVRDWIEGPLAVYGKGLNTNGDSVSPTNFNLRQKNLILLNMRRRLAAVSSSSETMLSKKPSRRLRKERRQGANLKQMKRFGRNDNASLIARNLKASDGRLPCPSAPVMNLPDAGTGRLKFPDSSGRLRAWKVRKVPEEIITFSKPQDCHLEKVVKSSNQVTVTFAAHKKTKNVIKVEADATQAAGRPTRRVKGLNETLLEKESRTLLAHDVVEGQLKSSCDTDTGKAVPVCSRETGHFLNIIYARDNICSEKCTNFSSDPSKICFTIRQGKHNKTRDGPNVDSRELADIADSSDEAIGQDLGTQGPVVLRGYKESAPARAVRSTSASKSKRPNTETDNEAGSSVKDISAVLPTLLGSSPLFVDPLYVAGQKVSKAPTSATGSGSWSTGQDPATSNVEKHLQKRTSGNHDGACKTAKSYKQSSMEAKSVLADRCQNENEISTVSSEGQRDKQIQYIVRLLNKLLSAQQSRSEQQSPSDTHKARFKVSEQSSSSKNEGIVLHPVTPRADGGTEDMKNERSYVGMTEASPSECTPADYAAAEEGVKISEGQTFISGNETQGISYSVPLAGDDVTDAPAMQVNKRDCSVQTTDSEITDFLTASSGWVKMMTSTDTGVSGCRPETEDGYPHSEVKFHEKRSNFRASKCPVPMANHQDILYTHSDVHSKKPPPSPLRDRTRYTFHPSPQRLVRSSSFTKKSTVTDSYKQSHSHKISHESALSSRGEHEVKVSPATGNVDRQSDFMQTVLSPALPSGCTLPFPKEIKVRAPCSVYTLRDSVNLSLMQGSDGKFVKLLVPSDDYTIPYEIVVEPGSWDDGPAMVVAENGIIHVSFNKSKSEDLSHSDMASERSDCPHARSRAESCSTSSCSASSDSESSSESDDGSIFDKNKTRRIINGRDRFVNGDLAIHFNTQKQKRRLEMCLPYRHKSSEMKLSRDNLCRKTYASIKERENIPRRTQYGVLQDRPAYQDVAKLPPINTCNRSRVTQDRQTPPLLIPICVKPLSAALPKTRTADRAPPHGKMSSSVNQSTKTITEKAEIKDHGVPQRILIQNCQSQPKSSQTHSTQQISLEISQKPKVTDQYKPLAEQFLIVGSSNPASASRARAVAKASCTSDDESSDDASTENQSNASHLCNENKSSLTLCSTKTNSAEDDLHVIDSTTEEESSEGSSTSTTLESESSSSGTNQRPRNVPPSPVKVTPETEPVCSSILRKHISSSGDCDKTRIRTQNDTASPRKSVVTFREPHEVKSVSISDGSEDDQCLQWSPKSSPKLLYRNVLHRDESLDIPGAVTCSVKSDFDRFYQQRTSSPHGQRQWKRQQLEREVSSTLARPWDYGCSGNLASEVNDNWANAHGNLISGEKVNFERDVKGKRAYDMKGNGDDNVKSKWVGDMKGTRAGDMKTDSAANDGSGIRNLQPISRRPTGPVTPIHARLDFLSARNTLTSAPLISAFASKMVTIISSPMVQAPSVLAMSQVGGEFQATPASRRSSMTCWRGEWRTPFTPDVKPPHQAGHQDSSSNKTVQNLQGRENRAAPNASLRRTHSRVRFSDNVVEYKEDELPLGPRISLGDGLGQNASALKTVGAIHVPSRVTTASFDSQLNSSFNSSEVKWQRPYVSSFSIRGPPPAINPLIGPQSLATMSQTTPDSVPEILRPHALGKNHDTRVSKCIRYPMPLNLPWSRQAENLKRPIGKQSPGTDRADSGYSEQSASADHTGTSVCEWDRSIKKKLQDRKKSISSKAWLN